MRGLKRPRDGNDGSFSSEDICTLLQYMRERAAMRISGPFFLERALFPRLLRCGSRFPDPTRPGVCDAQGERSFARLFPPQRAVTTSQLVHYKQMNRDSLHTVVPPETNPSVFRSVVTDIVFDLEEQFALVCHPRRLSAYRTAPWVDKQCAAAVVSVEAQLSTGFRPPARFAFSAADFFGSSLHVAAAYHSAPMVDVFDLEDVDEATSAPQQRFELPPGGVPGGAPDACPVVFASDVVSVTEHVALAALSSGTSVWLDRRSGKVELCTGMFTRNYTMEQLRSQASGSAAGVGPLSTIAFLCREDPVNVLCGTVRGAVQLWDVRCAREFVDVHQTSANVCRLHPSFHPDRRGLVWLNNYAGEVLALMVSGSRGIQLVAATERADLVRSAATFNLPLARIASIETIGLLACPHVSSNSLQLFDTNDILRRSNDHSSTWSSTVRGAVGGTVDTLSIDDSDSSEETSEENANNIDAIMNLTRVSANESMNAQTRSVSKLRASLERRKYEILPLVSKIPYNNVINYEGYPNVSACASWSKYSRLVVGDVEGRVQIA